MASVLCPTSVNVFTNVSPWASPANTSRELTSIPASFLCSLSSFAPSMNASAEELADILEGPAASGQPVDIWGHFGQLSMDVTGTNIFGCASPRHNPAMGRCNMFPAKLNMWTSTNNCNWDTVSNEIAGSRRVWAGLCHYNSRGLLCTCHPSALRTVSSPVVRY